MRSGEGGDARVWGKNKVGSTGELGNLETVGGGVLYNMPQTPIHRFLEFTVTHLGSGISPMLGLLQVWRHSPGTAKEQGKKQGIRDISSSSYGPKLDQNLTKMKRMASQSESPLDAL